MEKNVQKHPDKALTKQVFCVNKEIIKYRATTWRWQHLKHEVKGIGQSKQQWVRFQVKRLYIPINNPDMQLSCVDCQNKPTHLT